MKVKDKGKRRLLPLYGSGNKSPIAQDILFLLAIVEPVVAVEID
jgi:hypothetical protein